mgnify:FL=1
MLTWDEKSNIQKIITVFEIDIKNALDNALEYKYLKEFICEEIENCNKAPIFISQSLHALRYSLIMRVARLIDESKDSYGFIRLLNKLEMSEYSNVLNAEIKKIKCDYEIYRNVIEQIKMLRDKAAAHNDKSFFRSNDNISDEVLIEHEILNEIESLIRWLLKSIFIIETAYGDEIIPYVELKNDIKKLFENI